MGLLNVCNLETFKMVDIKVFLLLLGRVLDAWAYGEYCMGF
jgi:hypothetical protein